MEKTNRKRKQKRGHPILKTFLLLILIAILIFVTWFTYRTYKNGWGLSGMLATVVGHDENTRKNLPELKTLILGISTDLQGSKLTDTIMVASYNPNTQKAKLLSIPRDTFVGKNTSLATASEKMNAVYANYDDPEKVLNVVNNLLGLDLQNYVIIKNEGLIELVDAIGGVEFDVPINMNYDDKTQDLHIHLNAGVQKLDGDKAEQLVRFRHNNDGTSYPSEYGDNDIGRMKTQRNFIIATLKQTLKPGNVFKLGEILDVADKNIETNMDMDYLKDYIPYAVEFDTQNIQSEVLPVTVPDLTTTNNVSIAVLDRKAAKALIQSMFYDDTTDESSDGTNTTNSVKTNSGNLNNIVNSSTISNNTNVSTSTYNPLSKAKVEILNGTGDTSKLDKAKEKIEEAGFNVTKTGKTSTVSKTVITNRKDVDTSKIDKLKKAIDVGEISTYKSGNSSVDITVVLGKDFK